MAVSVVVPARNAAPTLAATLLGLARQDLGAEVELVVVDNGSSDATAQVARDAGARVVPGPGRGPGPARMAGVAATRHPVVAFTDADCVPAADWLRRGLAALGPDGALVQGAVLPDPAAALGPWDRTVRVDVRTGLFETANLLVRRDALLAAGGFGDGLEAPGHAPFGEDVLLGWAIARAGGTVRFAPEAVVHHAVFPRSYLGWLREQRRRALFAHLVREVPELRGAFLRHRVFLGADRDVLLVLPWLRRIARDARRAGVPVAAGRAVGELVGLLSALEGSVRARTLVV